MAIRFNIGGENFEKLRRCGGYYVDKTELLYELVEEKFNSVTLFTRPRRFGKTLMISMMENFFNIRKDSKEIFEGLNITKHKEFCEKYMNKYPVIFLTLKTVNGENFESAYNQFARVISTFCNNISGIENNEKVKPLDRKTFKNFLVFHIFNKNNYYLCNWK